MFRLNRLILFAVLLALLAAATPATGSAYPAPLIVEGPTLRAVLIEAAHCVDDCRCQDQVSDIEYERTFIETYRLTIYRGNMASASAPPAGHRVIFAGPELPGVFRDAAVFVEQCGCANNVYDVTYERDGLLHRLILHLNRPG
jgi:hypothetical protein